MYTKVQRTDAHAVRAFAAVYDDRYKEQFKMREKLTKRDVEKIEQEIEHRKLVVRKEAIEAVKEARAQGDLSENFEYYAAKRHKNQNESRIRYLERMLKTADIVTDTSRSRRGGDGRYRRSGVRGRRGDREI